MSTVKKPSGWRIVTFWVLFLAGVFINVVFTSKMVMLSRITSPHDASLFITFQQWVLVGVILMIASALIGIPYLRWWEQEKRKFLLW